MCVCMLAYAGHREPHRQEAHTVSTVNCTYRRHRQPDRQGAHTLGHCQLYIQRALVTSQMGAHWGTIYYTYRGHWQPASDGEEHYNLAFSMAELRSSLESSPDTAVGPDGINHTVLQSAAELFTNRKRTAQQS